MCIVIIINFIFHSHSHSHYYQKLKWKQTFISTLHSLVLLNIRIGIDIFITNQGKIGIEIKFMFGNCL